MGTGTGMSQKTQQGIGPVRDPRDEDDDDALDRMDRVTPIDSPLRASQPDPAELAGPTSDRSQFDTVPGGGVNRESGGRAVARAYVSPKTPMPLSQRGRATVSVDVEPSVSEDSRHFRTERALRVASLPPPSSEPPASGRRASYAPLWIAATTALVLGAAIVLVVPASPEAPGSPAGPGVSVASPLPLDDSSSGPSASSSSALRSAPTASGGVGAPRVPPAASASAPEPVSSSSVPASKKVRTPAKPVSKPGAPSAPKPPSGSKNGSSGDVWLE